ncbi:MAG TPA: TonB-dependent receptor [Longimicrobiales bacterium]|nr:TonB-dependent receptor [Longimicrobiales bacterium]
MLRVWHYGIALVLTLCGAAHASAAEHYMPEAADSAAIEGVVRDVASGRPLQGALVRVVGSSRQDVTHEGGEYHLVNLPPGRHTVLFERLGYRREVREVSIAAGETVRVDVAMTSSAIELPGIVVTGTTRASLGDETVRPANVVAGQELSRRLDVTLAATLENEPGLAVASVGPATARPVIRGLGGDRVLVLEDGARVGDLSSSSSDHALSVDPLNATRIEVVRGPAALLYGSNAIGGVINLIRDEIPVSLPEQVRGLFSVQGQSVNGGVAGGASAETGWGGFALRGEGSFRSAGDMDTPRGELQNTELRTYSLSGGISRIARQGYAGVAYRYYDNSYGIPGGFVGSHPEGVDVEMRRHALHGAARIERAIGPFTGIEADAKYTHYYHRELESADIIGTEYGLLTGAGEVIARHADLGPLESGAMGVRVGWKDFAAGGSSHTTPTTEWTAAAFVLEELGLGSVRLQGGARFDWHRIVPLEAEEAEIGTIRTRTFGSVSGSLGMLYTPLDGVGVGASIARAYRTPETGELFSEGPHLAAYSFEVGNPDLEAEVGVGLDVFVRVNRDRFHAELAGFRNGLDNYIYYRDTGEQTDSELPIYQATGTDAVLLGFEASGGAEVVRHLLLNGSVSYVRGTISDTDEPLPMMPPLRGQLAVRYERPEFVTGVAWRGASRQDRIAEQEFETETRGYSVVDADAGVRWTAFGRVQSVTLRVDNVTNELVYDHLSRIRDRDTNDRVPGPGRSASVIYRVVF